MTASGEAHKRLDRLIREFGGRIRALVLARCHVQQGLDPDDVEQEVRIRLWRALERDQSLPLPASYIQRVVVSVVVDALRRAAARPVAEQEEPGGAWDMDDPQPGPERRARSSRQLDLLAQCLQAIPPRRRVPLQLHLQGFRPEEISSLLGLSLDAVRKLVQRGLAELKERLSAAGLEVEDE